MKYIPLPPYGKPRPRVTRNGTYMPKKYVQWKKDFLKLHGQVDIEGNLHLKVLAVRKIPKSYSKKRKAALDGQWCATKPDIDNIVGSIMDAVLDSDSRVVSIDAQKKWGYDEGLHVEFSKAENANQIILKWEMQL